MGTKLATSTDGSGKLAISRLVESAKAYARAAKAENTRKAYASDWARFAAWCKEHGAAAMPAAPVTVALYLTARAEEGRKVATIERELSSISQAHRAKGHPSPRESAEVRAVRQGIRRTHGVAPRQAGAITIADLRAMTGSLPGSAEKKARDGALLLLGFAAALRRSELVALNRGDLEFRADGLLVHLRRSKADQEGAGAKVPVPYGSNPSTCPIRALRAWLELAEIERGAVFRAINRHGQLGGRLGAQEVARVIKGAAETAGLDASILSGHSLRAGLATEAARQGKPERLIMKHGRWRGRAMVDRYIRDVNLLEDNAAVGIGL